MKVKPSRAELIVRHPDTGTPIPPQGLEVPSGSDYWQRRLRDGDVVPVDEEARRVNARWERHRSRNFKGGAQGTTRKTPATRKAPAASSPRSASEATKEG